MPADVVASPLDSAAPVSAPVRPPEPRIPTTPHRAAPSVPSTVVERPAEAEPLASRPVWGSAPATAPSTTTDDVADDVTAEPAPDENTADDGWGLLAGKATDTGHVAKPKRRKRQHRARTFVVMTVVLAMVVGVGYVLVSSLHLFSKSSGVTDYTGEGETPVDVTVRTGDAGVTIANTLYAAEVVASPKAFVDACKASSDCGSIQPGTYTVKTHMSAAAALSALLNPSNRKSGRLTIPEGWTAKQIVERIASTTNIPVEDLNAAIEAARTDPASLGLPPDAVTNPAVLNPVEGWLFPTTYDVPPDATAVQVLTMMVDKTKSVLTAENVPQDQWERVLTVASIIEREVSTDEYRPMVARAIQNRLDKGIPLQADATTAYSLDKSALTLTSDELNDTSNPYNTRRVLGLPPGPIGSPREASIAAVLHPATGDWLYWCTVNLDTGETKFTADYAEFGTFKAELNAWLAANPQS